MSLTLENIEALEAIAVKAWGAGQPEEDWAMKTQTQSCPRGKGRKAGGGLRQPLQEGLQRDKPSSSPAWDSKAQKRGTKQAVQDLWPSSFFLCISPASSPVKGRGIPDTGWL